MKVRSFGRRAAPLASCALGAIALGGCASLVAPFRDADRRWADYEAWTRVTEEPSTGPSPGLGAVHRGPEGYRLVYVNDVGRDVMLGDGPYEYPAGTVVVKEQYADEAAWASGEGADVTVSVKVADVAGAGAANWRWADGYKGEAKESAFCAGCHSIPFAEDFVFSNARYLEENG